MIMLQNTGTLSADNLPIIEAEASIVCSTLVVIEEHSEGEGVTRGESMVIH